VELQRQITAIDLLPEINSGVIRTHIFVTGGCSALYICLYVGLHLYFRVLKFP